MNTISKSRLSLLLFVGLYKLLLLSRLSIPRAKNNQKGFTGLVDMRGQGSSDKDSLNVLKDQGPKERDRPSTKSGDIRAGTKAGTQ